MRLLGAAALLFLAAACRRGPATEDAGGGSGGGSGFSCAQCGSGTLCVDGAACAAQCPAMRAECAGSCCAALAKCCAVTGSCVDAAAPCPALCADGVHRCPEDQFCEGSACVATCDAARRCGGNTCCAPGGACVAGACELPDLVPLPPPPIDGGLLVERRNFDPLWCDVQRGCVKGSGERALLHFTFRVANQGLAPLDLAEAPNGSLLAPACTGSAATTLKHFARWELFGPGDAGVLTDGASDLHCLKDDAPLTSGPGTFTCTMQGLSAGFVSNQPAEGVCTAADVSNLDAGTYLLAITVNPTGLLPETRLDNNRLSFPVVLPDTSCRGRICGGSTCCPPNTNCNAAGGCALPDLMVDRGLLESTMTFSTETFPMNDCAVREGCLLDGGTRRLLRFSTSTPNVGEADFYVGDPTTNVNAMFDSCHNHYHYHQYANYALVSDAGVVVRGRKQAFCVLDLDEYSPDAGRAKYDCDNQGVSVGWADTYDSALDCQWLDITDVPVGDYVLEVEVNPNRYIAEKDYANNVARVPITIAAANNGACVPVAEICGNGLDEDCDRMPDDGCAPLTLNDTCMAAHELGGGGEFTAQIGSGTAADISPSCGGAGGDLFFKFHLMVPELVYLSTYGSSIDTVLSVYSGAASCPGTESACADDGCGLAQSHVGAVMAAGDYVVAVKAKNAGATGLVKLTLQRSTCTGARQIAGPSTQMGNNSTAANDFTASCGGVGGGDDLWYLVSCPASTTLTAQTCGATWDTVLAVKQGSCRAMEADCDDDGCGTMGRGSRVTLPLSKPGMWFLIVDGYDANDRGAYALSVSY